MWPWLEAKLAADSGKSTIAEAIRYALSRWDGLIRFLDDGRIEIDSNVVDRKNHVFAGSDGGGEHWAVIASLVETCKMNDLDPEAYLRDVLAKIVARHPMSRVDELLPFAYARPRRTAQRPSHRLPCSSGAKRSAGGPRPRNDELHAWSVIPRDRTAPATLVTAYRPDPDRWSTDFVRPRKR